MAATRATHTPRDKRLFVLGISLLLAILTSAFAYYHVYSTRIFAGVHIAGTPVDGLTQAEALTALGKGPDAQEIVVTGPTDTYKISTAEINLHYDLTQTVADAFAVGHTGSLVQQATAQFAALTQGAAIPYHYTLDGALLAEYVSVLAGQIDTPPIDPVISVVSETAQVTNGQVGKVVDIAELTKTINTKLAQGQFELAVEPKVVDPTLTTEQLTQLEKRANALLTKTLELTFERTAVTYTGEDLLAFLASKGGINKDHAARVASDLATNIDRPPQNPVFEFTKGKVAEFLPAQSGVAVEQDKLAHLLADAIDKLEKSQEELVSIAIPVTETPSEYATADINDLGINELLGVGTSTYRGSIYARSYNISLGSSKFNGVLVAPGETLSFNATVGDVSEFTGYKQSYIIQDGATVLGDGGGLCQVSTTLFRAAMDAGLPIVERRAHSYRVTYYEQDSSPGIDATVFSPTTDLKIKNDTPAHLLIQTFADPAKATLRFEIYGTADGRVSTVSKPVITQVTPPPEDLYIDDPTKPVGTVTQIDWQAWGAKVNFTYTVERDGETLYSKTFYSNYRPWQAKFLRGTAPLN